MLLVFDCNTSVVKTLLTKILSWCPKSIGSIANGLTLIDVGMNPSGFKKSILIKIDWAAQA
jgi:hypothetical protein